MATAEPHTLELEVSGNELQMFRDLLKRVKLSRDGVNRIRIEIESTKPLLPKNPEPAEGESTPEAEPEEAEAEAEPADAPESEEEEAETEPEPAKIEDKDYDGKPQHRYLAEFDPEAHTEEGQSVPKPEAFEDFLTIPLNKGTAKWVVCGLLYRTQGAVKVGQMAAMLEGTEWEYPTVTSYSSALTALKDAGVVESVPAEKGNGGKWQLTQLGRDYVESVVTHTEGYSLTPADRATGKTAKTEVKA